MIRREFGVSYHPAHVSRLLKALRHTLQKPQRLSEQRDEEAIEHWEEKKWPSLKKGTKGRQDHSLLRSIGLLSLLALVPRTNAPIGRRPFSRSISAGITS